MTYSKSRKVLTVIPARFASTRFPGKIIAPLAGKPLVLHTYERALKARLVSDVVIATDAEEVVQALRPFGVNIVMTRSDHPSGTDRIAEVAANTDADIIVNVQGDEPLIDPDTIDATIRPLLDEPGVSMATVRHLLTDPAQIADPNIVKVIVDASGHAIYFSRTPIPYIREEADRAANPACYWQHIGLYVYRRDFLLQYARMPQSPLERLEKLEQLRAIEGGHTIAVVDTQHPCVGVDTPEDLELVRSMLEQP